MKTTDTTRTLLRGLAETRRIATAAHHDHVLALCDDLDEARGDFAGLMEAIEATSPKKAAAIFAERDSLIRTAAQLVAGQSLQIANLREQFVAREEARAAAVAEAVALRRKLDDERALTKRLTEQREEWAVRNVPLEAALAEAQRNERVAWDAAGDLRYQGEITALLAERDEQALLASERLAEVDRLRSSIALCSGSCRADALVRVVVPRIDIIHDHAGAERCCDDDARELACPARHDVTGGAVACTLLDGHDGEHRYAAPRSCVCDLAHDGSCPTPREACKRCGYWRAACECDDVHAAAMRDDVPSTPRPFTEAPSSFADLKAPANLAEIVAEVADEARAAAEERTRAYRPLCDCRSPGDWRSCPIHRDEVR